MKFYRYVGLAVLVVMLIGVIGVSAQEEEMAATVALGGNDELGAFLVDSNGMTLYTFGMDTPGMSSCAGGCLETGRR